jgi:hypothetical protein
VFQPVAAYAVQLAVRRTAQPVAQSAPQLALKSAAAPTAAPSTQTIIQFQPLSEAEVKTHMALRGKIDPTARYPFPIHFIVFGRHIIALLKVAELYFLKTSSLMSSASPTFALVV